MPQDSNTPDFSLGAIESNPGQNIWVAPIPNVVPQNLSYPAANPQSSAQQPAAQNPYYGGYAQAQQPAAPQNRQGYSSFVPNDTRVPYTYDGFGTSNYDHHTVSRRQAEEMVRNQRREQAAPEPHPNSLKGSNRRNRHAQEENPSITFTENPVQAPDQPGSRISRGAPPKPPKPKKHFGWKVKLALVMMLLLTVGITYAVGNSQYQAVKKAVAPYDNVFMDRVYVDGVCLGGKTFEEGSQLINDHLNLKKNSWFVRIRNQSGEYNDITADTLGISFDPTQALKEAWAIGRTSYSGMRGTLNRQKELEQLNAQEFHFSSAQQSASAAPIDTILNTLAASAYREPKNAQYLGFDPENTSNPFMYQYEEYGQQLNVAGVKEQIMQLAENLESGEVMLKVESIAPSVTVNDLCGAHELRAVAYTPISTHSTEDRTDNIRLAFSRINGLVLNDGDKFSFNSLVGKRSIENGFKAAVEYQYGAEEWGIGGGVCQASTTVYLAAANAGMTIKTRKPHSMAVSYTDLGLDCTVNDTRGHEIDFVFINNSGAPIYITAHVIGKNKKSYKCEVRIYGQSLGNVKYQLKAETIETLPKPETKTVEDKEGTYVTYTDQTKLIEGRDGYKVQSYLIRYENNVEVSRKDMYLDTYPSKADTVYVGITPRGGI